MINCALTMAHQMQEAVVHAGPRVEIIISPIPKPGSGQLLIKTYFAASNPKDWKRPTLAGQTTMNQGDDVAGTVHGLGSNTQGFSLGDRVAALHSPGALFGTYAEFCIVEAWAAWRVPDTMRMAEAATMPLATMTAGVALWRELGAPWPWTPGPREPIVIYGASSAVGAFAVKLAKIAGLTPVIAIAGNGREFVESLLNSESGDRVVDYRDGEEATVEAIKAVLNGRSVRLALDAISATSSEKVLGRVLNPATGTAKIATVLPLNLADDVQGIKRSFTMSTLVFADTKQAGLNVNANRWLGATMVKLIEMAVADGSLKGHPYEVVEGGLNGIETGLLRLQNGSSAVKFVYDLTG
jgi:NADPH2:quinone reductase